MDTEAKCVLCYFCDNEVSVADMYRGAGPRPQCNRCRQISVEKAKRRNRDYYRSNQERIKSQKYDYRRANRAKLRDYDRRRWENNSEQIKEKFRARYRADPERTLTRNREYYKANAPKVRKRQKNYRLEMMVKIQEVKLLGVCADCGQRFHPCAMDFDHIPERGPKVSEVSTMPGRYSWAEIEVEIAKCELVCSNCHRVRTFNRRKAANE